LKQAGHIILKQVTAVLWERARPARLSRSKVVFNVGRGTARASVSGHREVSLIPLALTLKSLIWTEGKERKIKLIQFIQARLP